MNAFFPEHVHSILSKGLDNGDYYLKLCGAGGGGFMLGFTENWDKTQEDLKDFQLEEIYRF
jgi:mevalonate kinase